MQRIQKTIQEFLEGGSFGSVTPGEPVSAGVAAMRETRTDCVVVVEDGVLCGIFTERDFLNRVAALQRDPRATRMREVMTSEPVTLQARDCISYAINRMATGGIRNIPIIDDDGRPIAVLDVRDVMSHLSEVFDEVFEVTDERPVNEWIDIGGGA